MPRGATPGRNLGKEVGDRLRGTWWWTLRTVNPRRVLSELTWGNVLPDRRETAGREPLSARSPVVGKTNSLATGSAGRG